ncbi:MAG: glycolate oxidase subunit GlcE [Chromatiales bacterium 21-64-14]|nr:MAG: glycolate oxidase subunit GlcE [Chromatiales bacterium 21-64-14]HQU16738.1 glycolate oxidase subunit GlcE [Gammaproteobacteria bacterium]
MDQDLTDTLEHAVRDAHATGQRLCIQGGGTKGFYGRTPVGKPLGTGAHRGIIAYEPTELVITARAGTPLDELEVALANAGQMLPFEPPHFGAGATLGGTVATGLSGPRRPYCGAVRDFVLGVGILNGTGARLSFGGQVIKNVAGYDLARLMAGAFGTLGVLLQVSLKVLPSPECEATLARAADAPGALTLAKQWLITPLPLSGVAWWDGTLYVRLSGTEAGVRAAQRIVGGDPVADGNVLWRELREQRLAFFTGDEPLWRLSVPPGAAPLDLPGRWLLDWGGAQRWLRTAAPARQIREIAAAAGGHATGFRYGDRDTQGLHPLPAPLLALHRRLKAAFDPRGILNPGRMYPEL